MALAEQGHGSHVAISADYSQADVSPWYPEVVFSLAASLKGATASALETTRSIVREAIAESAERNETRYQQFEAQNLPTDARHRR